MVGLGTLIAASGSASGPSGLGRLDGAALGDWVFLIVGYGSRTMSPTLWPLSSNPELWSRPRSCHAMGARFEIFIGRFLRNSYRAFVPLAAGMFRDAVCYFQIAISRRPRCGRATLLLVGV